MSEPSEPEYPPPSPYAGGDPAPMPPPAPAPPRRAPDTPARDYQADLPASPATAGWALALALVGCVPCLWVVALVLGIKVIGRGRDGRDHGSGLAIAAICVAAVVGFGQLATVALALADGGEDDRGSDGPRTTAPARSDAPGSKPLLPTDLDPRQCFDDAGLARLEGGESGTGSATVSVIPCDRPHQFEVFGIVELPVGPFPGDQAVTRAQQRCVPQFRDYTGSPYRRSPLELYSYFPTRESWRLNDRSVVCILADPRRERVSRSFRQR